MSDIQVFRAWSSHDMVFFLNLHEKNGRTKTFVRSLGLLRFFRAFCGLVTCDTVITSQKVLLNSVSKE